MPAGWRYSIPGALRRSAVRKLDRHHRAAHRAAKRAFTLPDLPKRARQAGEVWAIFLVKNEADIIAHTISHAAVQGIDRILVVDNGSTDETLEIVRSLSTEAEVHLGFDSEPAYYQSEKMTWLARWAARRGADWVVPMDADEFWFAADETVGNFLRRTNASVAEAALFNLFPTPQNPDADGLKGALRFDHSAHILGKVALRAHPLMWLGMGNHWGTSPGLSVEGLFVAHLPWRSFEQFERKTMQGAQALELANLHPDLGRHWRQTGTLPTERRQAEWHRILTAKATRYAGWTPVGPFEIVEASHWTTWPFRTHPE